MFDLKKLNSVDVPEEISWSIKRAVHREAQKDRVISLLRPVPFLTSGSLTALDQDQLQRYILPPQIGDWQGTGLFENQMASLDTSRSDTPVRLPGARAVSF